MYILHLALKVAHWPYPLLILQLQLMDSLLHLCSPIPAQFIQLVLEGNDIRLGTTLVLNDTFAFYKTGIKGIKQQH